MTLTAPFETLFAEGSDGLAEAPHTKPESLGAGPPRSVTLPLPVAPVEVMAVAAWVVTVGARVWVVKVTSAPYTVPSVLLVA